MIVSLIYCRKYTLALNRHGSAAQFTAAPCLPTKKVRGAMGREMFTLASQFSDKLSAFLNRRGVLFSIGYQGFSPISLVGKHFLLSTV